MDEKTIGILVEDQYEDLELWYPFLRMQEAAMRVLVIGMEKGRKYVGKRGYPISADLAVAEVDATALHGLIIPGGMAPDRMRVHEELVRLVRDVFSRGRPVAMICHAGWVGISADIVRGRRVTSVRSIRDDLVNAGADWVDREVVVDGNLITARTPPDLPAFCKAILNAVL